MIGLHIGASEGCEATLRECSDSLISESAASTVFRRSVSRSSASAWAACWAEAEAAMKSICLHMHSARSFISGRQFAADPGKLRTCVLSVEA